MTIPSIVQKIGKSFAVFIIFSLLYVRFMTAVVLDFISLNGWSIIGLVIACVLGIACRVIICRAFAVAFLAVCAFIAGAIWLELHFSVPLSHDTAESATWVAYLRSALMQWRYVFGAVAATVGGWHLGNSLFKRTQRASSP
jgi:hypothetical protein